MTSNVLLLLPSDASAESAVREAIEAAKARGGRLVVAGVLQAEMVDKVSAALTDVGFMGEKVSDQVRSTLLREYRTRGAALASEVAERARRAGIDAEDVFEEGDPTEICRRLIPAHQIGLAILVAERRSWLTRLLAREPLSVPALAGCEVRVIEEDD